MIHYILGFSSLVLILPAQASDTAPSSKWSSPSSARDSNHSLPTPEIADHPPAVTKPTHEAAKSKSATAAGIASLAKKGVSSLSAHTSAAPRSVASSVRKVADEGRDAIEGRLARLTAYWSGEGDYYTGRGMSSTGIHLHGGHCAVDPSIIPYGSVVDIAGLGKYLAVDTGSAVISRAAAREAGHTAAERGALVIDLFFESRGEGERFAANGPKFASISWSKPSSEKEKSKPKISRHLLAEESGSKNPESQL